MPRPKTIPDREVVRATARVLLRIGPGRFTLRDVASESGLSPATLLQRFGSKRGLLLAFAQASVSEAALPFAGARQRHSSPIAALREALVSTAHELRTRQEVANSLSVLLTDLTDDEMCASAALHARATERAIRKLLDEAVLAGELDHVDTGQLALSVQAAWNGAIIQWALRGSGSFPAFLARVLGPLLPHEEKSRRMRPTPTRRATRRRTS